MKSVSLSLLILIALTYSIGIFDFSFQPVQGSYDISSNAEPKLSEKEIYYKHVVQPILNNRCAVCHSCNNAACQLNLTSYEGFLRGANKHHVYQFEEKASPLTRLGIDATDLVAWRGKKFFPVFDAKNPEGSLFTSMINMKTNSDSLPDETPEEARSCPSNQKELQTYLKEKPNAGMPFGLPMLDKDEKAKLGNWLSQGAQGPSWEKIQQAKLPSGNRLYRIRNWENFLNAQDLKQKLVSRYIYEHWFLAHLYFADEPTNFYSLVRSKTACTQGVDIISSRRPNDDPGSRFFYCFQKVTSQVVNKTHLPLEISTDKLQRFKNIFYLTDWQVKQLPSYDEKLSANPFIVFHDIPAKARYRFLLEDSQYHINTFIRGPVCFGNNALNSIDEQFFTLFINPESDFASRDPNFETEVSPYLFLPSYYNGSNAKMSGILGTYGDMVDKREDYRKAIAKKYKNDFPQGYSIKDLWNGDGHNDNAALTIFRHKDSATVLKGFRGDLSKTVYVLDYPLFERLVYNLVVNYDVYGNLTHQAISRIYMDFIRMEAEENYLLFMPPGKEHRKKIRKYWYRGVFAHLKMKFWYKHHNIDAPTQMTYDNPYRSQAEFVEQVAFNYLNPQVRGPVDLINWKRIIPRLSDVSWQQSQLSKAEINYANEFKRIASVKAREKIFPVYFPDLAFVLVQAPNNQSKAFTIVHHREHYSLAFITNEDGRRDPENDSLSIFPGYVGSFPNLFFSVTESELSEFVTTIENIRTQADYEQFKLRWGIARTNKDFWKFSDWFYYNAQAMNPSDAGLFDLTRYDNNVPERKVNKYIKEVIEDAVNEDDEDRDYRHQSGRRGK